MMIAKTKMMIAKTKMMIVKDQNKALSQTSVGKSVFYLLQFSVTLPHRF